MFPYANLRQNGVVLVYSALATAWSDLGFDAKATATARKAMDMAGSLPPQARLQTEARYHEM
ncbi:MAG: hypothetical protein WBR11_04365, partial [Terriglobales bacterium]